MPRQPKTQDRILDDKKKRDSLVRHSNMKYRSEKTSVVVKAETKGFEAFHWSRQPVTIDGMEDEHYLIIGSCYLDINENSTIASSSQGYKNLVDVAGAPTDGNLAKILLASIEADEMKDIDVAANGELDYFCRWLANWIQLIGQLTAQSVLRDIAVYLTYADAPTFAVGTPCIFTNPTYSHMMAEMSERAKEVPTGAITFINKIMGMVLEKSRFFQRSSKDYVPESYFYPFTSSMTYAELFSNADSPWQLILKYSGKARNFARKFKIPTSAFSPDMFKYRVIKRPEEDADWVALLSHYRMTFYDVAAKGIYPYGAINAGDVNLRRFFQIEAQHPSIVHRYHQFFDAFDGTNCPFGAIFTIKDGTAQDDISFADISANGTAFAKCTITDIMEILNLVPVAVSQHSTGANWSVILTGTNITNQTFVSYDHWLLRSADVVFGVGLTQARSDAWSKRGLQSIVWNTFV